MIDKYSRTSGTAVAQIVEPCVVGAEYKGVVVVLMGVLKHEYGAEFVCATTKSIDDARRTRENQTTTGNGNFVAMYEKQLGRRRSKRTNLFCTYVPKVYKCKANLQVARLAGTILYSASSGLPPGLDGRTSKPFASLTDNAIAWWDFLPFFQSSNRVW